MNKINKKELLKAGILLISYIIIIPNFVTLFFDVFHFDLANKLFYILANVFIYVISLLIIFFLYYKDLILEFKIFIKNFKSNFKVGIHSWLKALAFMMLTNLIIVSLAGGLATNEQANRNVITIMPIFSILSMCLIGPFLEEMIFRKSFKDVFDNKNIYLIVSSLLFGGAHLLSAFSLGTVEDNLFQLLYLIPYSGIGYFFAKAYLETDTIFTSTMIHIFHNTFSVILVLLASMGV